MNVVLLLLLSQVGMYGTCNPRREMALHYRQAYIKRHYDAARRGVLMAQKKAETQLKREMHKREKANSSSSASGVPDGIRSGELEGEDRGDEERPATTTKSGVGRREGQD